MKKLIVVLLLCLSAFGQTNSSGRRLSSGAFLSGTQSQGGPLSYAARTDPCVLGYAFDTTNCASGATTGQYGSALSFLGQTGDPMPWYQTPGTIDPPNTAIVDPDFGSYQMMVTSGEWGYSTVGLGNGPTQAFHEGSGEWDPFSQDNSLLLIDNNQGAELLVALSVPLIRAKGCSPSTPCAVFTGVVTGVDGHDPAPTCPAESISGTGCTLLNSSGSASFSRTPGEGHVIYERMGSVTNAANVQVNKLLVTCSTPSDFAHTTCTFTRTPYVNFASDYADPNANVGGVAGVGTISAPCSVLPNAAKGGYTSNSSWTGGFSPANDGSVGYTMGGAPNWLATTAYATPDSFIYPTSGNTGKDAFQATQSGTTGSTAPVWDNASNTGDTICDPNTGDANGGVNVSCEAGQVQWTNIDKIGGQGPGFDMVYFNPKRGCSRLNTRSARIYRGTNEGSNWPVAATPQAPTDPSGVLTTDSVSALFNHCLLQYGSGGPYTTPQITSCQNITSGTLTDEYGIHDGNIQMDSTYFAVTPTGGGSAPAGSTAWEAGTESCRGSGASYKENSCYKFVWKVATTLVRPLEMWTNYTGANAVNGGGAGHETTGYGFLWKGGWTQKLSWEEPVWNLENGSGSGTNTIGNPDPGIQLLITQRSTGITNAPWDEHGSEREATPADNTPVFLLNTAVPAPGRRGCVGSGAGVGNCLTGSPSGYPGSLLVNTSGSSSGGYNEITAMASTSASACLGGALPTFGTWCQWRFAHNWGTGSVQDFRGQNEQGMVSQDGTLLAFATDVMGTRGSISDDWTASTNSKPQTNATGYIINPVCISGDCVGGNTKHSSLQNLGASFQSCNLSSGCAEPNWSTCGNPGQTCSEFNGGSAVGTWTNVSQPATGSTGQLPCNGLRGDFVSSPGTPINLNDTIYPTGNNSNSYIFQAVSFTSPATGWPINEGSNLGWNSLAVNSITADDAGINWKNLGANDCRTDVVLIDLLSTRPR